MIRVKRLHPIAWNGLAAASALLFVATAILWVWSDVRPKPQIKTLAPTTAHHKEWVVGNGYVMVSTIQWLITNPAAATASFPGYPYGAEVSGWDAIGLHWRDQRMTLQRPTDRKTMIVLNRTTAFSVWLGVPLLLFAILPVWWWLRRIGKINREKRKGTCRICGYDLRATPNRCPECGATPGKPIEKSLDFAISAQTKRMDSLTLSLPPTLRFHLSRVDDRFLVPPRTSRVFYMKRNVAAP